MGAIRGGRRLACAGLALLVLVGPGCIGPPSMQAVNIMVTDPAAEVFADGVSHGTGSMTIELRRGKSHDVEARLGDRVVSIHVFSQWTGSTDVCFVLGFFLILPWIACFGDDACELNPSQIVLVIPPAPPAEVAQSVLVPTP